MHRAKNTYSPNCYVLFYDAAISYVSDVVSAVVDDILATNTSCFVFCTRIGAFNLLGITGASLSLRTMSRFRFTAVTARYCDISRYPTECVPSASRRRPCIPCWFCGVFHGDGMRTSLLPASSSMGDQLRNGIVHLPIRKPISK